VLFRQFVDDDLGCASYLIGDERAGRAVVVDPAFAIEPYLAEAERHAVRIERVLETHNHADHVAGHGRLALEHGVSVSIHPAAEPAYAFDALADGDELEVGDVSLRVMHTPGHRPEHCAFAVADRARADEPWLVLTGDSLFVGDAARPDLAVAARDGAHDLFHSLRRLAELPDGVEVYPGHVAGSLCGAAMSSKASTTIGFERRFNKALAGSDEEEFVARATGGRTPRPPNLDRIVELNRGPFVGAQPDLEPVRDAAGATVLDVRPAETFAAGHLYGALNIPVSGTSFATRAGFVLAPDEPVVLHAASSDEAARAARGLRAVGLFELRGYLDAPEVTERIEPVGLEELERLLADGSIDLVDVREADERDDGYIAGSRHIPYRLLRSCGDSLANGRPVVTICETGARAGIAASVLVAAGIDARPVLDGGIPDWEQRGNETVGFRRCGA
jgi:glyoxylase-like metal-dependent hydrolase (beta-lactamase superfamily II)/rhodanese-related sulfurtransferase